MALAEHNFRDTGRRHPIHLADVTKPEDVARFVESFDVVTCNDVIEHVKDPAVAIAHIASMLRPGGLAYFEIPNRDDVAAVVADGHYQLYGITQLDRDLAGRYYEAHAPGVRYGVEHYLRLHEYRALFERAGLTMELREDEASMLSVESIADALAELGRARPDRMPSVPDTLRDEVASAVDAYLREAESAPLASAADRDAYRLRYGVSFWHIIACKPGGPATRMSEHIAMHHPKPGTSEYAEHVEEEIEHYGELFKEGEGRETLMQPIPPSWQECERRAAMLIHERTGAFLNGHVENRLNARPDARFLSLGSGPGGMEIGFAQNARHAKFMCMDINGGLMELGRQRAAELGLDMEFIEADLNVVELPVGEFDVVYCAAALHHLIELERLAEQITRALRPGGELVTVDVVTPNGYMMWPETRKVVHAIWTTLPERFRVNHTAHTTPQLDKELWEADQSAHGMECVRSGDILPVLEQAFEVKAYVPYFSISRRFLDTMYGPNYDLNAPLDKALFDWIWALDRHYLDTNALRPETFFGIYAPKRGA